MKLFTKSHLFMSLLSSSISSVLLFSPAYGMYQEERDNRERNLSVQITIPSFREKVGDDREEDKEIVGPVLRTITQDSTNLSYVEAMYDLFVDGNVKDKEAAGSVFRAIAQDSTHPHYCDAVQVLFSSGMEEDKELAGPILRAIAQDNTHPRYCDAVQTLFSSGTEKDKEGVGPVLREIARDNTHPNYEEVVQNLFYNGTEKDKRAATPIICRFALDSNNAMHHIYRSQLFENENEEDNAVGLAVIRKIVQDSKHQNYYEAVKILLSSGTEEDKEKAGPVLRAIAQDSTHLNYEEAVRILFLSGTDEDKRIIAPIIHSFVQNSSNTYRFLFALHLLKSENEEDKTVGRVAIKEIAQDNAHPSCVEATEILFYSGTEEDKREISPIIRTLFSPELKKRLLEPDISQWRGDTVMGFFLKLGNENQQLEIYNICKNLIIQPEEGEEDIEAIRDAVNFFIETIGEEHPWTQELIELAAKRANVNHPNSPFAVYWQLRGQVNEPVNHNLPQFQLVDKRSVTFNLKTLQTKRQYSFLPIKHNELVGFTKQLVLEANTNPEEFKLFATESLINDPKSAVEEVNKAFFKNLLDRDDESKDIQSTSLTSFKLRRILTTAKELHCKGDEETKTALTPPSQLILSLLNNVLTCSTGKEDGIDVTYRLLTNRRGGAENELQQDRLSEEIQEFFQEEMRCIREGLLNGEGPVVRSLLNKSDKEEIFEPTHQTKYLHNLMGAEIGTSLEGKGISFDLNGGCAILLRNCSKQQVLNTLYQFHTPETIVTYFHDRFNAQGFEAKVDGKNKTSDILAEFLPEKLENPHYIVYNSSDVPTSITPLAIAELLLRTNILEALESN